MALDRKFAALAVFVVGLAACGEDVAVPGGQALDDATTGAGGDATLTDGWQFNPDASAPDGWTWNVDAGTWVGPDAQGSTDASTNDSSSPDSATGDGGSTPGQDSSGGDTTPAPGELGGFCETTADCAKGTFCAGQGSPEAYCTTYGCAENADCAGISANEPVCCLTYGKGVNKNTYCLKQYGATQCGKQDQPVGGDCTKGGQSDCSGDSNWCFQTSGGATCVQTCQVKDDPVCGPGTTCNVFPAGGGCLPYTPGVADSTPCAGKTLGGCGPGAFCIERYAGDPLAYCATACQQDADCPAGNEWCFLYNGSQGICLASDNSLGVGQNCAGNRFGCKKGTYCVGTDTGSAVCAPSCSGDAECGTLATALGTSASCVKNGGNATGICYPNGDGGNGTNCADNPYTCGEGLYCVGGYDTFNPGAYCQKTCTDGSACPANSSCVPYSADYSGCQPNGPLGQGGDCKGDQTQCKAGSFCIGAGSNWQCMTQCALQNPQCPGGTWCMPYGQDGYGLCWPEGDKPTGSSCFGAPWTCQQGSLCGSYGTQKDATCLQNCDAASCPGGFSCVDFGQSGHWCQPVGPGKQGAACSPTSPCAQGAVCIGQEGPAPFCSTQCKADSDCPADDVNGQKLWCAKGKWGGYCIPDGGVAKNGPCFQKPWSCAKGLVCLGDPASNPDAFCAAACSGFASICSASESCVYLGGGDAYCVHHGTLPAGETCLQDPGGCAPGTLCIKGSPQPECIQQCGVGFAPCPSDSPCTSFPGTALKLCVPKGFVPFGAISVPF